MTSIPAQITRDKEHEAYRQFRHAEGGLIASFPLPYRPVGWMMMMMMKMMMQIWPVKHQFIEGM